MVYTRPSSVLYPKVWHRFTVRRAGAACSLRVQDLTEDTREEALDLLSCHFTRDEPPCKYIGINNHPSAVAHLESLWRKTVGDKLSLVCVEDKDDGSTALVGVNVLTVACKEDEEEPFKTDDRIWAQLFGAVELVGRGVDVFQRYGVDKYLNAYGLVVAPEWRGCSIGKEILKASNGDKKSGKKKCICNKIEQLKKITGNPQPLPVSEINKIRLNLFTERNSDGTGYLVLRGKDIHDRYNRRIRDTDITAIFLYIREAPRRITKIDLCYNNITDVGFFKLLKRLLVKGRSSVTDLNIMNNNLTYKSIEYLARYAKYIKLKKLRLNGNDLGTDSGKYLAQLLLENDTIEFLDLGETSQTLTSLAQIIGGFRKDNDGNETVKVLDLSRLTPLFNRYSYETKWLAYHIEYLLERNSAIIELHLQKNQLIAHDLEYLVRGLRKNTTILYLDIGYNRIGNHGAQLLAEYLTERPQLIYINIAGNGIGDLGVKALSYCLPYSKVRALDISSNKLSDQGVIDLLNTIKKRFFLKFLNIWGNELGQGSCELIQRMLTSGTLYQDTIDVKIYEVDELLYAAYYPNPANRSKHFYYCELEFGYAQPIYHIKRNVLPENKIKSYLHM